MKMLSPGFTWPPLPFATIISISLFGFQPAVSHVEPDTFPHNEPVSRKVPER